MAGTCLLLLIRAGLTPCQPAGCSACNLAYATSCPCFPFALSDEMVFGNQGVSLTKLQLQSQEALGKVREAIDFLVRGVRLLGSDVANSGRLFTRAALGECQWEAGVWEAGVIDRGKARYGGGGKRRRPATPFSTCAFPLPNSCLGGTASGTVK